MTEEKKESAKKPADIKQVATRFGIIMLTVIVAGFLAIAFFHPAGDPRVDVASATPAQPHREELSISTRADTYGMCKYAAAALLLSPASAKWESAGDVQFIGNEAALTIRAPVDSQNVYGAMLRQQMTCEVQKSGDTWKLMGMELR